jgi:hypothetical protein
MRAQGVLQIIVLVETDEHNMEWTKRYLKSGITTAFPGLKSANIAIQIIDEEVEDRVLYINKLGQPSQDMKDLADEMFAPDPVEAQPA